VLEFSAETRRSGLERMADSELDVLVLGGGITGCGVALDAASRGLSVGLVERVDFAAGTSGRSSRMIHGGVRYLQHYEFGLVREALRERSILRRLAPHLIRPLPMLAPASSLAVRTRFRLGLAVYDALALGRNVHRSHAMTEDEVRRAAPGLSRASPGFVYYECGSDDARLTLEVARAAHGHGAVMANHAEVEGFLGQGRVRGARVTDRVSGEQFEVRARVTVNAGGIWADRVQSLATDTPVRLTPSKGVHLVFRPGAIRTHVGLVIPSGAGDRRFVFLIPSDGRVYAGTTDTVYEGELDEPPVTDGDRDYILAALAPAFPEPTADDVVASWAGLRPLLGLRTGPTADLSRRHAIFETPPGLVTITGGKLTTYRSMAEEVVDRVAGFLGRGGRCRTRAIPLGLEGDLTTTLERAGAEAAGLGLSPGAGARMVHRFGEDWAEAMDLIRREPQLGEPAAEGLPVLKVEEQLARTREMALTEEDVLYRRTRLATLDQRSVQTSGG
jgi:glycerol-3-phosphate dehydrogenase